MLQAEFILSNLFIIHPDSRSNYKLRIVINHQSSEQKIKETASRYRFALALNETMLRHPYGFIYLMQQTNRTGNYLQIGKGELDFNEVLASQGKEEASLNGVIYGSRATNFDRIIAKYGYRIVKHRVEEEKMTQRKKGLNLNRIKFKDHKAKEKLPVLRFKESIIDRNNDLNAKIQRLSDALAKESLERENIDVTFGEKVNGMKNPSKARLPQAKSEVKGKGAEVKKSLEEKHHYFYKISEKIEKMIQEEDWVRLKWLQIKNIQLFKYRTIKQQASQAQNSYDNDLILLTLWQGLSKICEVVIKLIFNTNNRFIDLILPIPASLQSVSITISFFKYNTERLQGTARVDSLVNRTVDLCNGEKEEKGFLSLEVMKNNELKVSMEKYKSQAADFITLSSKFPNSIKSVENYSQLKKSQDAPLQGRLKAKKIFYPTAEIPSRSNNLLYNSPITRNGRFSQHRNHSVLDKIDSDQSTQKRIRKSFDTRSYLENSQLSSISPSSKPKESSSLPNTLSLKIKNIYIHFYEDQSRENSFLQFILKDKIEVREVISGFNNLEEEGGSLILNDLQPEQSILLRCSSQNQQNSRSLGSCSIPVKDLIKSTGTQLKIFLTKGSALCGYLIFEVSLYRIKNNKLKIYKKIPTVPSPDTEGEQFQLELTQSQIRFPRNTSQPRSSLKLPNPSPSAFDQSFLIYQQQYQ